MKYRNYLSLMFLLGLLALFTLTRAGLAGYALWLSTDGDVPLHLWPLAFAKGLWFDLAVSAFLLAPVLAYEALVPQRIKRSVWHYWLRLGWVCFSVAILLFGVVAEFTFWTEFSTRFNFIAVDYLLYTHEVIANIEQSYPVGAILFTIVLTAVLVTWTARGAVRNADLQPVRVRQRVLYAALAVALPMLSYSVANVDQMEGTNNAYIDELSGNGLFSLAAAMRRNELDYDRFYRVMPQAEADALLRRLHLERVPLSPTRQVNLSDIRSQRAQLSPAVQARRPRNVVLVSVESLSASFLGAYGATDGLTPNLDRIAREGWQFNRVFATGTRTVRGLEALSIGTPPVPGQSIVRRPKNEHLATIGELLKDQGFATQFIYGGYGYFDNMNAYFSGNDYEIVDRTDFPDQTIVFENAWGVADESLFDNSLNAIDREVRAGKRVFTHIMTTSNHRPYTYPDGRIDIPSPGKRPGAVKYTDYAIGKFIEDARAKPWFNDTLFVFIADHGASVAGKSRLPVEKYHIPLIMYAPALLKPATFDLTMSQIDVVPTLLDMLGVDGGDAFFGTSVFRQVPEDGRAFISNYQELGYLKRGILTVLSPKQQTQAFHVDPVTFETTPAQIDKQLLKEAIAYYQTASREFKAGDLTMARYRTTHP